MTVHSSLRRWGATLRRRNSRGAAEIGVAVLAAALLAGVVLGNGAARTLVRTGAGLVWLGDGKRGQVVQVNPETGKPQQRLKVGAPGDDLQVTQRDGKLIVLDKRTGRVTVIDLGTLLVSGRRDAGPGSAPRVLLDHGRMYLIDLSQGLLANVDPRTAATIGQPWLTDSVLADAGVDQQGEIWLLDQAGGLRALHWSGGDRKFTQDGTHTVAGAGPGAVLVPHPKGVTVVNPEPGIVEQVGTGHDVRTTVAPLRGPLHRADSSPADLVPVSAEGGGTVVMVSGGKVLEVGVGALGCTRPGAPAVFNGHAYVPCLGGRKVVVLDRGGRRSRSDLTTPAGTDPELVVADQHLFVNVPGASSALVVDSHGAARTVGTDGPTVPVQDPEQRNTLTPPTKGPRNGRNTSTGMPTPPSGNMDNGASKPTHVTATARPDGTVLVGWTAGSKTPDQYMILCDSGATVATAPSSATSATVSSLTPGTATTFTVVAVIGDKSARSAPSDKVTVFGKPGAPVQLAVAGDDATGNLVVTVTWSAAPDNGSKVAGYQVAVVRSDTSERQTAQVTGGSAQVTFSCGGTACPVVTLSATVTATNGAGDGPPGQTSAVFRGRRVRITDPQPGPGRNIP